MIVEYLRYTISSERQAEFIDNYQKASVPLLESEFCEQFEFCQCIEDPSKFIIRIQWTSAEDHLQGFRGSAALFVSQCCPKASRPGKKCPLGGQQAKVAAWRHFYTALETRD